MTLWAAAPIGEERLVAGPSASGVPSRARIGARSGTRAFRTRRSPGPKLGKTRLGDQATLSPASGSTRRPEICPKAWVSKLTGTAAACRPPTSVAVGSPVVTRAAVAVSWALP